MNKANRIIKIRLIDVFRNCVGNLLNFLLREHFYGTNVLMKRTAIKLLGQITHFGIVCLICIHRLDPELPITSNFHIFYVNISQIVQHFFNNKSKQTKI